MARRRDSRLRPRDYLDKAALVLAFLLGITGIVFLKWQGFDPLWVALYAAGVLVAYVLATWLAGQLMIEPESIGDNAYYLGFLLTLASLSVTLVQLAEASEQTDALREIIAGFGVALSSTIVGVFLRVLLAQIRPDIVARDRESRAALHQAAREFRTELAQSIATMKSYGVESVQLAAEQGAKIARITDEIVEAQRARLESDAGIQSRILASALEAAADKVVAGLGAATAKSARAAETEVAAALASLAEAVKRFGAEQEQALAAREARGAATEAAAAEALARATGLVAQVETLSGRLATALESVETELGGNVQRILEAREALEAQAEETGTVREPKPWVFSLGGARR